MKEVFIRLAMKVKVVLSVGRLVMVAEVMVWWWRSSTQGSRTSCAVETPPLCTP